MLLKTNEKFVNWYNNWNVIDNNWNVVDNKWNVVEKQMKSNW